jgi:HlyD family secretion protein
MPQNYTENLSYEVQHIISSRPNWVIRQGQVVFLVVLLGILSLLWFLKFPDKVDAPITIETLNGPKLVKAKTEGTLVKLLVKNETQVKKGQPLAYIQSTGSHEEVLQLKKWITNIEPSVTSGDLSIFGHFPLAMYGNLGDLQAAFQELYLVYNENLQQSANGYYTQKQASLLKDIENNDSLLTISKRQQKLIRENDQIGEKDYQIREGLAKERLIAALDLTQEKSKRIGRKQELENNKSQIINNLSINNAKKKELIELNKQVFDLKERFKMQFFRFKSNLETWTEKYLPTAPTDGLLTYASILENYQAVEPNKELFHISPQGSNFYGVVKAPQAGIGKVKIGQEVNISLSGFPREEFGMVIGQVAYISTIPAADGSYLLKVKLPNGLTTSHHKKLAFKSTLQGQAKIITKQRRLLERIFSNIMDNLEG